MKQAALYVRVARVGWVGRSSKRYLIGEPVPKFRDPYSSASPVAGPEQAHHESITCSAVIALSGVIIFEYPVRYTLTLRQAPTVGMPAHGAKARQVSARCSCLVSPGEPGPTRSRTSQVSGLSLLVQSCARLVPSTECRQARGVWHNQAITTAQLAHRYPRQAACYVHAVGAGAAAARCYGSRVALSCSELRMPKGWSH